MKANEMPRIFHINGVKNANSISSYLIPDGSLVEYEGPCEICMYDAEEPPTDIFVQGFDDLVETDPLATEFFPEGPPLIGTAYQIDRLASVLTGVVAVRVGFKDWNQRAQPERFWFSRRPLLKALHVTAVCRKAYGPDGFEFPRCDRCGRMSIKWYLTRKHIGACRIDAGDWPMTDLFLIEGGVQSLGVFVTEVGLAKMASLGFRNVELEEINGS